MILHWPSGIDNMLPHALDCLWITKQNMALCCLSVHLSFGINGILKVHQDLNNPPVGPSDSGIGGIMGPLSKHFFFFNIKNFLTSFHVGKNVLLASLDVENLYTCIRHHNITGQLLIMLKLLIFCRLCVKKGLVLLFNINWKRIFALQKHKTELTTWMCCH